MSATPFTPTRSIRLPQRAQTAAAAPQRTPVPQTSRPAWKIGAREITDPRGQTTRLARHGVDKYATLRLLKNSTVLYGNYPSVEDVTEQRAVVDALVERISDTGALFTVYASLYREGSRSLILLDDLY